LAAAPAPSEPARQRHERFIGFLIEHYAGNFPLWLAPDRVRVITLHDDEALINYAKPIVAELRANRVRADADFRATPFKAKIANAEHFRPRGGSEGVNTGSHGRWPA
jgi:threonyl-tRNA synthetase